ncbi:MAG: DNA sulfur modification protein DndB [Thalassobaculum sp.]|uniref:DNA sulfur modification protein DndB n=1 Tax=Thalassobaculum sp. TaxID=2022740 RepID=UPI0032EC551E
MTTEAPVKLNPTQGNNIAGVEINTHLFLARVPATQLFQIAPDPRDAEDRRKVEARKELQDLQEIRQEVQRLFAGAKARNVQPYANYIIDVHHGHLDGMTPPIILFTEQPLLSEIDEYGKGFIQIPFDQRLVAIDGETQLAARYEAAQLDPETKKQLIPVYIAHGYDKAWARQCFHDLNVLGVRPNAALSIGMDARDPLTRVTRDIERHVPFFRDRVNKVRRQLRTQDREVVTITSLRGACITFAEGIAGVKYGSRPVHIADHRLPLVTQAAIEWFKLVTDQIGAAMEDRENKIASAPSVLAAIGAIGHPLAETEDSAERSQRATELVAMLRDVDWRRGKHWEGIAGKFTPRGAFSVGGTKETGYAVFDALSDTGSPAYRQIRRPTASAAE